MKEGQRFNWAGNRQAMYYVNHASATNKWGTKRGYRIVPGRPNVHLSTLKPPFSLRSSAFAKSHLGMHHFTRAEDVPVTLYCEAVSSVLFAPQNFFDHAQDSDLRNRRWIVPHAELMVEDFSIKLPTCKVDPRQPVVPAVSEG
ncbi:hypothetical protein DL767_004386 [Monosporascus sp. MG133]|nr:hypothetical protein DL767_004386 [Monosporascus sp. MG133]